MSHHSCCSPLRRGAREPDPLAPHLAEIIFALVVFGILFCLIRKFVVPNFEKTFAERTAAIEGGLAGPRRKQAEADAQLAELEAAARRGTARGGPHP